MVQKYLPSFAQHGASQSGEPPQGDSITIKPMDVEHLTNVRDKWEQGVLRM
jgi:hypothetical protein